ncbi:MAG TPA: hypothetical protein VIP98_13380 [Microlunatus sp.]
MTDFDSELRRRLADAAGGAPRFDPAAVRAATVKTHPRHVLTMAVAAAIAVLVLGGGIAWLARNPTTGGGTEGGAASCAAVLTFQGRMYDLHTTVRLPQHGQRIGKASYCSDTVINGTPSPPHRVGAYAIPGVPTSQAFVADSDIWVYDGLENTPPRIAALERPIVCGTDHPESIAGHIVEFSDPAQAEDKISKTPYSFTVLVTQRAALRSLGLDRYLAVRVKIKITDLTRGRDTFTGQPAEAFYDRALTASVRCRHERFLATSIKIN